MSPVGKKQKTVLSKGVRGDWFKLVFDREIQGTSVAFAFMEACQLTQPLVYIETIIFRFQDKEDAPGVGVSLRPLADLDKESGNSIYLPQSVIFAAMPIPSNLRVHQYLTSLNMTGELPPALTVVNPGEPVEIGTKRNEPIPES